MDQGVLTSSQIWGHDGVISGVGSSQFLVVLTRWREVGNGGKRFWIHIFRNRDGPLSLPKK
jgi:hypothetical protein